MEQELKQHFGSDIDVRLVGGSNGVFEITFNDKLLFSKRQLGRFPEEGEIVRLISRE